MTNLFKVEGQTLTPIEIYPAVSDTVNYLTFAFMFSYDWAGLTKSAIITKGDDKHEVVLVNDAITADKHVNLSAGEWTLSVVGSTVVDAVVTKRITTTPYTFTVTQADAVEGEMFPPSIASQVYVNVNQAAPQTFVGGIPKLAADRVIDHDNEIADKKYVDDHTTLASVHNALGGLQGGSAGEYYHTTQAQNAALHAHSNKVALDAVSGTNTGDQDVSGAVAAHNSAATAHAALFNAKQDTLTAGTNITITDNVISASGGGAVNSVNGEAGDVVLTASEVGADASGTASSAVAAHNISPTAHTKKFADYVTFDYLAMWELDNRSDWNENDMSVHGYILNKPTIPTTTSELANDSGYATESYVTSAIAAAITSAIEKSY